MIAFLYTVTILVFICGAEIYKTAGEQRIEECIVIYVYQLIKHIVVNNNLWFRNFPATCFGPRRPSSGRT
jgi:hypothetical protein